MSPDKAAELLLDIVIGLIGLANTQKKVSQKAVDAGNLAADELEKLKFSA